MRECDRRAGRSDGQLSGSHHSGSQPCWMQYCRRISSRVGGVLVRRSRRADGLRVGVLVGVGSDRSSVSRSVVRVFVGLVGVGVGVDRRLLHRRRRRGRPRWSSAARRGRRHRRRSNAVVDDLDGLRITGVATEQADRGQRPEVDSRGRAPGRRHRRTSPCGTGRRTGRPGRGPRCPCRRPRTASPRAAAARTDRDARSSAGPNCGGAATARSAGPRTASRNPPLRRPKPDSG